MRGAAQAEAVGEQAGPVFARSQIAAAAEALAPEVLGPFLAVPVVRVPPQPGGQGLVLVGGAVAADDAAVHLGLRGEEALEGRAGQLAGIPRVIGADLRIADAGHGAGSECKEDGKGGEAGHGLQPTRQCDGRPVCKNRSDQARPRGAIDTGRRLAKNKVDDLDVWLGGIATASKSRHRE